MEFKGRVTRASKKNFLLVDARFNPRAAHTEDKNNNAAGGGGGGGGVASAETIQDADVLLSFGKVSHDPSPGLSLDFCAPFTPVSALFVALTTFADKLAVA